MEKKEHQTSQNLMDEVYSLYWKQEKVHGPEEARVSLTRRFKSCLLNLEGNEWVLDLGAGRQAMERQWMRNWRNKIECNIATVDISSIRKRQLLQRSNIHHSRADGARLPYKDGSFSAAISSMGLELMPTEAIPELARVLKPGGKAFINVLHPSISTGKAVSLSECHKRKGKTDNKYDKFWEYYAREDNVFGKGKNNIQKVLEEFGFGIDRIETVSSYLTAWIEIDITRNEISYGQNTKEFIDGIAEIDTLELNMPFYLLNKAEEIAIYEERKRDFWDNMNA